MSLNPMSEARYRFKLASGHLERGKRAYSLKDWVGTVQASQLAVENYAKSVVAAYETPTWSHDPSNQLLHLAEEARVLAIIGEGGRSRTW